MKFPLLFILIPFITFGQSQIGQTISGEFTGDLFGTNVSLSSNGNVIAIGALDNDGNGTNSGHVRIYERNNSTWEQIGQDIDGESIGDLSGISVSLSCNGRIVAIGASNNNNDKGHVRIYQRNNNTWEQLGEDIDGDSVQQFFGKEVSLSCDGSIVSVSANLLNTNSDISGQVTVFKNEGDNWLRLGNTINYGIGDTILDTTISLSHNGSIIAVGSSFDTGDDILSGNVRVYMRQEEVWGQIGDDINNNTVGDQFGRDISLSSDGKILAISSTVSDTSNNKLGQVTIYKNEDDSWEQIGSSITGEMEGDQFGRGLSLSFDGSIVAIGARLNNGNGISSGSVRIYQNDNNIWRQIGEDIDGEMAGDQSGISVSLSENGKILAIGSNLSNGGKGHVRVFDLNQFFLSVKEASITSKFKLFPNPAPFNVTVQLPQQQTIAIQDISIYNNLGQLITTTTTESTIDTSDLPKGIYIVQVTTDQGTSSKKLIIE